MSDLNVQLVNTLKEKNAVLITAESLTGGLISQRITAIPGSSDVFWGGLAVYAVEAKERLLGVHSDVITRYGVVSNETAAAMAEGAVSLLPDENGVRCAIAVTGVAGPKGGSPAVPVGTVCTACLVAAQKTFFLLCSRALFTGDRTDIREQTYREAVEMLLYLLDKTECK